MNLEQELKDALARKSPSAGFAARVLERVAADERRPTDRVSRSGWRAVAAALTMTAILGGWAAREAVSRRAGERAGDEVMTALRITSEKLRVAQDRVQQIGSQNE